MSQTLYAARFTSTSQSSLYTVDPTTAVLTLVGAVGFGVQSIAFDPTDGTLYAAEGGTGPNRRILTIDTATGAGTAVGSSIPGSPTLVDLAFNASGNLFAWDESDGLFLINKITGSATDLGFGAVIANFAGIVFIGSTLFGLLDGDVSSGSTYHVNTATGDYGSPLVRLSGYNPAFALGMLTGATLDQAGTLYAIDLNSTVISPACKLVAVNPTSGVVSLIGAFGSNAVEGLAWSPPPPPPAPIGICIAFGYDAYDTSAVFTRIDDPDVTGLQWDGTAARAVTSWSTDRGRSYELDKTQTGTAQITLYDTTGIFDPTNPASPFYGEIVPMLQAKINVQNPSNGEYTDIFTGFIESYEWTMDTAETIMTVTINLIDGFEPLTRGELQPDATGTTVLVGDAASTACQTRINALLDDATWPTDGLPGNESNWRNINTGNVRLQETIYNPQTSFLAAIQDCADAEFPGVANVFVNKRGAITFYGRYTRFQPTNYPNDVQFWQAADRSGLAPADGAALISEITWALDQKNLINMSLCYPYGVLQSDIEGQIVVDPTSITKYGIRTLSLPDLIVDGQNSGGGISPQPSATPNETAKFYAQYYVDNYADPQLRISHLEFRTRPQGDSQTWAFILGVEIGDIITVFTSNPGGGGFGKETDSMALAQFFVEGIHNQVSGPVQDDLPDWIMTLDVSPRAWFTTETWGDS